jgi:hypothetical protein
VRDNEGMLWRVVREDTPLVEGEEGYNNRKVKGLVPV